jgi:hypothetical protein
MNIILLKRGKSLPFKQWWDSGWKWVSLQLIREALWMLDSRNPELTLRVTKSWAFICQTLWMLSPGPTPLLAVLLWSRTKPLLQEVFGPSCPAPFNIKAPLRAKDFEKIGKAQAPYHVPALSGAGRKFRASAAAPSPLRSSCPKVSKDKPVTPAPPPGSWGSSGDRRTRGPRLVRREVATGRPCAAWPLLPGPFQVGAR